MDDIKIRLIQYLFSVAGLKGPEIAYHCGATAQEISEALNTPNVLPPPIPEKELGEMAAKLMRQVRRQEEALAEAISDYRIAALESVRHDEMLFEIVKSALDSAEKSRRRGS